MRSTNPMLCSKGISGQPVIGGSHEPQLVLRLETRFGSRSTESLHLLWP